VIKITAVDFLKQMSDRRIFEMTIFRWIGPFSASPSLASSVFLICVTASAVAYGQADGGPTRSRQGTAVYFIDIKDGDTLPPKAIIHFGLRGMGVAPAGSDRANSGHHHLLIDTELVRLNEPIPNDFNHLHFGAGQTETEVRLPPGPHTLQLVLGDSDHVPHSPPIVSELIHIRVTEGAATESPVQPSATYFIDLKDGDTLPPKATIHFGLRGMGVAPAGSDRANSGHHHLLIDTELPRLNEPIPNDFNHLHFGAGQTEAEVTLPPGPHTLQLLLGDGDHVPHSPPIMSELIHVRISEAAATETPFQPPAGVTEMPAHHPTTAAGTQVQPSEAVTGPAGTPVQSSAMVAGTPVQPSAAVTESAGTPVQSSAMAAGTPIQSSAMAAGTPVHHPATAAGTPIQPSEAVTGATGTSAMAAGMPAHYPPTETGTPVRHSVPANAKVFFVYPTNGAYVSATTVIQFGVANIWEASAGREKPDTCYYHLLIDAPLPPPDQPIPNDFHYLRFGGGETEARVALPLGTHTLQLLLGDENHMVHMPPVYSRQITVTVTPTGRDPRRAHHSRG
jgi:hypothetical protein